MYKPYKVCSLVLLLIVGLALIQKTQAETTPAPAPTAKPSVGATAGKSCDELKSEIDTKLKAKGVKTFTLDIVAKADVKDGKVVGSCERGSKKITYKKG
jgi:hypothetical protein